MGLNKIFKKHSASNRETRCASSGVWCVSSGAWCAVHLAGITGSIPASEASSLKEQMRSLLESESSLRSDVAKLQELLNLAQHQSSSTQLKETVDQMELASLRTQLRQFQSGSDEKTLIGGYRYAIVLSVLCMSGLDVL